VPDLNRDIPQFPKAHWEVDIFWDRLEVELGYALEIGLDLNPDFQRGHVWTESQQREYVEYVLQGGEAGKSILFNCPRWPSRSENYVILDGLQRLTAVRRFLADDLAVFGHRRRDWTGPLRYYAAFRWRILSLPDRPSVLRYYLAMNGGGTPHSPAELDKVKKLLAAAEGGR
jgi:hypothetical protein